MAFYGARVEYALHTLLNLTFAPGGTAPSARDLADFQRLPVAFMRKLLTQLEKAGLIEGTEGVRGGWRLARDPKRISALEVAEAAEGRTPLFECREIRARCALWPDDGKPKTATTGVCEIHAVMLQAEAAMRRELGQTSLADILAKVEAKRSTASKAAAPAWFADRYAERRKA
ncbi:MAG: Rrf2 family transcriptional regulator [Alphaproteobacteria bacterium]|nr:Rrf2 family transcriptional regulator [Alphaproteobacteria bacterium]